MLGPERGAMMDAVRDLALMTFLGLAVFWDLTERRIPNVLVLVATLTAIVLACAIGGPVAALWSLAGFAGGLGLLLVPFASGLVGGGDAKFLAAVGAFLGPSLMLRAFLFGTALGVPLAILAMLRAGQPVHSLLPMLAGGPPSPDVAAPSAGRKVMIPYAVPLALGAFVALVL